MELGELINVICDIKFNLNCKNQYEKLKSIRKMMHAWDNTLEGEVDKNDWLNFQ